MLKPFGFILIDNKLNIFRGSDEENRNVKKQRLTQNFSFILVGNELNGFYIRKKYYEKYIYGKENANPILLQISEISICLSYIKMIQSVSIKIS